MRLDFALSNIPETGYFSVEFERRNQALYVFPKGELDLGSAQAMSDALASAELEGATSMVIDMALVSFLDCSGLSVVVGAYNRACRDDRELAIVNAQPAVRRMFVLTGCKDMLNGTPLQDPEGLKAPV
jgi:anti-anti-sigma factor